jgi:TPR repeat protein
MFSLNNLNNNQIDNIFSQLTVFSDQKKPSLNLELIKDKEGNWSVNTYKKPRYIRWFISLFYKSSNCRLKNIQLFLRTFFEKNTDPFTVSPERAKLVVNLNKKLHFLDNKICLYENILSFQVKAQEIINTANLKVEQIIKETDLKAEQIIKETDLKAEQIIKETDLKAEQIIKETEVIKERKINNLKDFEKSIEERCKDKLDSSNQQANEIVNEKNSTLLTLPKAQIKKDNQELYDKSTVIFCLKNKESIECSASRFSQYKTLITGIINHSGKPKNNQYTINLENYSKTTVESLVDLIYGYTTHIDVSQSTIIPFLELYALTDYLGFTELSDKCKETFQTLLIQNPGCIIDVYNTYLTNDLFISEKCEDTSDPTLFIGEFLLTQLFYTEECTFSQLPKSKKEEFFNNLEKNIENDPMKNLDLALGICYNNGINVLRDAKKAYEIYSNNSDNVYGKIMAAQSVLSVESIEELLKEKNLPPLGYTVLGMYYLQKETNEKKTDEDVKRIESYLKQGADFGCPLGQCMLGCFYKGLYGAPTNQELSRKYLELSAKQGLVSANDVLGKDFFTELSEENPINNYVEFGHRLFNTRRYLEIAYRLGHADAAFDLGGYYGEQFDRFEWNSALNSAYDLEAYLKKLKIFTGEEDEEDDEEKDQKIEEAKKKKDKFIQEAADRGSLEANEYLGKEYLEKIKYSNRDEISEEEYLLYIDKALKYFSIGLKNNDSNIQCYCGELYESIGDTEKSLLFYGNSAEQGNCKALYRLGYYWRCKDDAKAFDYLIRSAKGGNKGAMATLNYHFFHKGIENSLEYISKAIELGYSIS